VLNLAGVSVVTPSVVRRANHIVVDWI